MLQSETARRKFELGSSFPDHEIRNCDAPAVVEATIPEDIRFLYDIRSYRSAAIILSSAQPKEFADIIAVLREFAIATDISRRPGNSLALSKLFSQSFALAGGIRRPFKVTL